ncbi:ETX/MTX2 family pore-forming toxin [Bacillus sp. FSL K6-6038]|uniref:ETX/MTX2 family pore-forming toxin n=1 Tax=Bacillus TaxID=1386 RepID=UPI00215AE2B6|nr:ETX/MTX2 family pore-forming toxin [Bacillus pseudomycoides]MCR8861030.1 ETX/MTX2 family pore-forming toxin [Bacillus pseudomycoides]
MAIDDINSNARNFMEWRLRTHYNPSRLGEVYFYPYEIRNAIAVPKTTSFRVTPQQKATSIQVLENNTSIPQSQTVKFSEKTIETVSNSTTEGYKIGTGVKSTTKASLQVKFPFGSGGAEQSLELSVTSEYNHSSTSTTTHTTERLWEVTQPVTVPAYSRVTATLVIMGTTFSVPMDLTANLHGTRAGGDGFCAQDYWNQKNEKWWVLWTAGHLANGSWPNRPKSFVSVGPNSSLNLKGASMTTVGPGLYSTVKFDQTPLEGYENALESKTWYSNEIQLRDGQIVTVPSIDPVTGDFSELDPEIEIMGGPDDIEL